MTTRPRHAGRQETWIEARAKINRGWRPRPKHAVGGRHADTATRRGRRVMARVFGIKARMVTEALTAGTTY